MRLHALAAAALVACCGGSPVQPGPTGGGARSLSTGFFTISYTAAESAVIEDIARAADLAAPRILEELGVAQMPPVRVTYYTSHGAMADAVRSIVGSIPPWATGLVTSPRDIHLIFSGPATPDGAARAAITLTHEFAHCVTLQRNPGAANNPRWLWETTAIYTARQRADAGRLAAVLAGSPPAVADLNSFENSLIYDIGYSLGEFIVERAGADGLRALVAAGGDTQAVLGLGQQELVDAWFSRARSR